MWKHIEHLRQQPEEARRGVAFLLSLSITGIILVSWYVLPKSTDPDKEKTSALMSPFAALGQTFSAGTEDVGEKFKDLLKPTPSTSNTAAALSAQATSSDADPYFLNETSTSTASTSDFYTATSSATSTVIR